jgi:hypothetical protein
MHHGPGSEEREQGIQVGAPQRAQVVLGKVAGGYIGHTAHHGGLAFARKGPSLTMRLACAGWGALAGSGRAD